MSSCRYLRKFSNIRVASGINLSIEVAKELMACKIIDSDGGASSCRRVFGLFRLANVTKRRSIFEGNRDETAWGREGRGGTPFCREGKFESQPK